MQLETAAIPLYSYITDNFSFTDINILYIISYFGNFRAAFMCVISYFGNFILPTYPVIARNRIWIIFHDILLLSVPSIFFLPHCQYETFLIGRTGTCIASWLLFSRQCRTAKVFIFTKLSACKHSYQNLSSINLKEGLRPQHASQ